MTTTWATQVYLLLYNPQCLYSCKYHVVGTIGQLSSLATTVARVINEPITVGHYVARVARQKHRWEIAHEPGIFDGKIPPELLKPSIGNAP